MERALNHLAAGAEEIRKTVERELKCAELMATFKKQLAAQQKQQATLTFFVEMLLTERDSWKPRAYVSNSYNNIYFLR
jgi:hypothetical protein